MLGNTIEEPSEQHIYPTACSGGDERIVDQKKFAKRVFEAESQRVDSVFYRCLDHQPTYQEVQNDMARDFELDRFGSATEQIPIHPLFDF